MDISRRILKKAAKNYGKGKPVESPRPTQTIRGGKMRVEDIGESMKEFEEFTGRKRDEDILQERAEEARKQMREPVELEKNQMPRIIDFSVIRKQKKLEKKVKELEEEAGRMRNIPLKAHKIPTQYLKKMGSAWKAPALSEINQLYYLIKPFSMANLKWNKEENKLNYYLIEPYMTKEQVKNLQLIKDIVVDLLDINLFELKTDTSLKDILREKVDKVIEDYGIKVDEQFYQKILYYMYRDFLGLSSIEALMHDPNIEDISCDGVGIPLYIYHRKYASVPTNLSFDDEKELNKFIIRIAQRTGKHISVAEPLLDGALPDGSRVQATFSTNRDISMHGSTFTIRKFSKDPLTITDLLNFGTIPPMMAAYMWLATEYRNSLLIAGGTATGKTSFLNTLSMFIPSEAKIVSIEDTPEIRLPHEHWVQTVIRSGFGREDITGRRQGEITMYDLLRAALRQRPDNLVVGEVRGKEAYVLFQGMATGHAGLATIHGDSVDAVMHRLKTPPINLSPGLMQHLNVIIVLTKARIKGIEVRRVKEVVEVIGLTKEQEPILNTLFKWNPSDDTFYFASDKSYVLQRIIEDKGLEEKDIWEEVQRRTRILEWMKKNNIRYYVDVGKVIQKYYSNPDEILKNI